MDDQYSGCCLYDWDIDGKPDLVTAGSVYRNTGAVSPLGVPVLTKLCDMPPMTVKGKPYCFFIGIIDHDDNGVGDAFYMYSSVHYEYEGPPPRNFIKAPYRKINSAAPGQPPVFDRKEPILRNGEIWTENALATDSAILITTAPRTVSATRILDQSRPCRSTSIGQTWRQGSPCLR